MTRGIDAKTIGSMRREATLYLTDTCTLQRATLGQDTTGEVTKSWVNVATSVRCGLITQQQRLVSPDRGEYIQTIYTVNIAVGTDVQKGDRLVNINSDDNAFANAGPIHILEVLPTTSNTAVYVSLAIDYIPESPA